METMQKLEKKAQKRIELMRQSTGDKQNAYPCIFMKKKRLPGNKVQRLQQMDDSNHTGVWVQFSDTKVRKAMEEMQSSFDSRGNNVFKPCNSSITSLQQVYQGITPASGKILSKIPSPAGLISPINKRHLRDAKKIKSTMNHDSIEVMLQTGTEINTRKASPDSRNLGYQVSAP